MTPADLIKRAWSGFLPNGFKYIVHANSQNPIISLQLYVRTGSAWEKEAEAGYSHFIEHLVFKRTKSFPENEIMRYINSLGGTMNAYTDFDSTCYYLMLPSEYLSEGLRVLAELAIHPCFGASDVKVEKDIICEEIRQTEHDPEMGFLEFIQNSCFTDSPLRKPVLGTIASVRGASLGKLTDFYKLNYRPKNAFLVVAGDLDADLIRKQVDEFFGSWMPSGGKARKALSRWLLPERPKVSSAWRKNKQEFIAYALPELCDTHSASDALLIAIRYLAIGRSSRLFKRLVQDEKLASAVNVTSFSGVYSGVSAIIVNPMHRDNFPLIDRIFREEYRALFNGIVDHAEIDLVKTDIINGWLFGFEGLENLAGMIGAEEFISGFENLYAYDNQVRPIDAEQVVSSVREFWKPSRVMLIRQSQSRESQPSHLKLASPVFRSQREPHWPVPACAKNTGSRELRQFGEGYYLGSLPNGIGFCYHRLENTPVCGFSLSSAASQLMESDSQRGLNYLCSASILHSTLKHDHAEIQRHTREHGISLNVENHHDSTIFKGKCFHRSLPEALSVLAELLLEPKLDPRHVHLVKTATIDMLRREKQNPASFGFHRWQQMLMGPNNPLGAPAGSITTLRGLSRQNALDWHRDRILGSDLCLAVAGPNPPEEIHALAASVFTDFAKITTPLDAKPSPLPLKTRKIIQKTDSGQCAIHLGGFAPPAKERIDTTAFYILAQIVGGDMDSRLFNIVREKHGFAYQIGLDFVNTEDLGYWFVSAYCDPQDYRSCLKLIRYVLSDVCANGISAAELEQAQNYLCGMYRLEMESVSLQAMLMSNLQILGYEPEFFLQREERIRSVTLDMVNRLAAAWFGEENQWTHILL